MSNADACSSSPQAGPKTWSEYMKNPVINKLCRGLIVFAVGAIIWNLPVPSGLTPQIWHLVAVFIATICGFVIQPLPVGAVAIISLGFVSLTKMLTMREALSGFSSTTVWLIAAAFLYAQSFIKTGLGRRIAYGLMYFMGDSSLKLGYTLALSDMIIAPATPSNTARAGGVLFPIVRSVASGFGSEPQSGPRKVGSFLMQTVFQSNCVSSSMFLTASAPNALIMSLAASTMGVTLNWGLWTLAALIPGIVSFLAVPYLIYKMDPPELKHTPEAKSMALAELKKMGPLTYGEKMAIAVFIISLLAWSTASFTKLDATAIAICGVGMMLATGVITWADAIQEKNAWDALVWLGVMITLADALNKLGLFKWFALTTSAMFTGIPWQVTLLVLLTVYVYSHYFFAGSTPHVVAMYAAFGSVSVAAGAPPMMVALAFAFVTNLMSGISHYGNGPAVIYFAAGYVPQTTWWKVGGTVMFMNLIIWFGIGSLWWKVLGLW